MYSLYSIKPLVIYKFSIHTTLPIIQYVKHNVFVLMLSRKSKTLNDTSFTQILGVH